MSHQLNRQPTIAELAESFLCTEQQLKQKGYTRRRAAKRTHDSLKPTSSGLYR